VFTRITNSKLFKRLKEKKYRNQFIAGEVRRTIPFQLRAMRVERKWTQADLGKEADMPQTVVSRIENGDAASLSIKTLLKLASAFDVALVVRFEPIDRLIHWVDNLAPEVMSPQRSDEILARMEAEVSNIAPARSPAATGHLRIAAVNTSRPTQIEFGFTRQLTAVPNTAMQTGSLKTVEPEIGVGLIAVGGQ
jgi:transcriptional regulator with XRE-family HTH domain